MSRTPLGWTSPNARAAFAMLSVVGVVLLVVAWFWYGVAYFEEMTEQCKALVAGTSAAGTGLALGAVPLVIAYVLIAVPLVLVGWKGRANSRSGVLLAFGVLAAASLVAIGVSEILWNGELFTMSAGTALCG